MGRSSSSNWDGEVWECFGAFGRLVGGRGAEDPGVNFMGCVLESVSEVVEFSVGDVSDCLQVARRRVGGRCRIRGTLKTPEVHIFDELLDTTAVSGVGGLYRGAFHSCFTERSRLLRGMLNFEAFALLQVHIFVNLQQCDLPVICFHFESRDGRQVNRVGSAQVSQILN